MKKTVKYIILTAVAGAVLASCQREQLPATATGDGPRIISVSFADATKTALDGIQAKFCAGDIILVSNGEELEDCKVGLDDSGNAQITTTLKGELKAVYPSEAAVRNGNAIDLTQIRVPIAQRGRFKDAHICTSTIAADGSSATFINRSAILKFYVDKSIGVTSIKVTGTGADIATGSRTITVTAPSGKTLANVTDDPQKRICYVAVLPGVNANQLTFKTEATTQLTLPRTPTADVTLEAGTLYKAFIPYYVTIGTQKWGYCNVGAFLPEEYGKMYSWGNPAGQSGNGTFNPQFNQTGYPTPGKSINSADDWTAAIHDAAYNDTNWGHNWLMPAAFTSLAADGVWMWTSDYYGTGKKGYIVYVAKDDGDKGKAQINGTWKKWDGSQYAGSDAPGATYDAKSDIHIFLPAAGYSDGTARKYGSNDLGYYWSSTFIGDEKARALRFGNNELSPWNPDVRYHGRSIRPILNDDWHYRDLDDGGTI